jgi:DNA-binding CsgD family transcriptional regulator
MPRLSTHAATAPFTHRHLAVNDLDAVFSLLRERFAYRAADRERLVALWRELLRTRSASTVAVEDRRLPVRERLVGFGMSVFATDDFARRARGGLPLLSRAFLAQWESGERPYLSGKEVAVAQSRDGVNLAILHYGWSKSVTAEDLPRIQFLQTECFVHEHAGYRIKEYLHEGFGPALKDFLLATGAVLRHDYREKKWRALLSGVAKDDWPYLTGFRADERLRVGTFVSMVAAKGGRPRFRFSAGEQDLLTRALEGRSDEELAEALGISPWTVKKRWQAIYIKVDAADAELLAPSHGERGRQRRRYLLAYLREHPKELRPFHGK